MTKGRVGSAPVGFWKFVIVVTVGLSIFQKFLIRDPNLQFLKSLPAFVVAIVLWVMYRHFHSSARTAESVSAPLASDNSAPLASDNSAPLAQEPAPREARVDRVLTADDLRRLHASRSKKTNRIDVVRPNIAPHTSTSRRVTTLPVSVTTRPAHEPNRALRSKTTRYKAERKKTIRAKRAPERDSRELE